MRKDEHLADGDPCDRTDRIERLREVEPARRGFGRPERADIGVARRFEYREPGESDQNRGQVEEVASIRRCRGQAGGEEEERPDNVHSEPEKDPRLEREAFHEHRAGDRETAVAERVADHLNPRGLSVVETHDPLKRRQERVGHVVCQPPPGEEGRQEEERPENIERNDLPDIRGGRGLVQAAVGVWHCFLVFLLVTGKRQVPYYPKTKKKKRTPPEKFFRSPVPAGA